MKIMIYAGFAGMAGLFSRTSMALAGVMMLFGMGRLQWYGKVDHYHHVLWFTLLLAASPCGDALSIDALRAAWKRARNGQTEPPGPAQRYQVPLAFAMLLIALIYLFPGLWKICRSGLDWALSDSPKYLMYQVWFSIGGFLPKLRYDQHPLLYKAGALAGLLFELSFVFLVLDKRLRYVGAALGVLFHTLTEITLTISFDSLRACYVVFVNWHALLQKLAAFLFPKKRIVSYDPSDLPRVRWIALLRTFDVFGRIDWRPVHGRASATPARTVSPPGKPLFVLGSIMLAAVIWTGAFRMMDGWPFACYPPFDGIADATYRTMTITLLEEDGSTRVLLPDDYRRLFGNRWNTLMQRILDDHDPAIQNQHLKLIFSILAAREPLLQHARLVQFGTVSSSVEPSRWNVPPGNYQLVLQVPLHDLLARPAS
ncbi:MAG: HTTM domain-containing protein [Acidobacteriaceae bacterium]|nr:HTTM domain-containing protein [Acidobacteriaceae bacterium]